MVDVQKLAIVLESLGDLVEGTLPEVPSYLFAERLIAARDLPELKKLRLPYEALDTLASWARDPEETRASLGASRRPLTKHGLIQSGRIETKDGWFGGDKLTPEGRNLVDVIAKVVFAPVPPEDAIGASHSDSDRASRREREKAALTQLKKKMRENLVPRINKLNEAKAQKFSRDAIADITTRLGSSSERDRFIGKFDQVWELADQDGVTLTDLSRADVKNLQDAIVLADGIAQHATREHSPHAPEIRRFTTELKDIAKKRTTIPGEP